MSTKTTDLIKSCTNLKKALKTGKFFKKHKLSCEEVLLHNKINKLINKFFSLKTIYAAKCLFKILNKFKIFIQYNIHGM